MIYPNATVQELRETFNVHWTTVERWLVKLSFKRKLERLVLHSLTANQRDDRIATCVSLLSRYKKVPLLTQIATGDEKRVMYVTCRRTVCRLSDPPALTLKVEFHLQALLQLDLTFPSLHAILWEFYLFVFLRYLIEK